MTDYGNSAPSLALIDNDTHSAQLLVRVLKTRGAPAVQWYGGAENGMACLKAVLEGPADRWPTVLIVDLKAHSSANLEFVESVQGLLKGKGISVLVLAAEAGKGARSALLNAGAAKVFVRHANVEAYADVAAGMVEFCSLTQRAEAVGM